MDPGDGVRSAVRIETSVGRFRDSISSRILVAACIAPSLLGVSDIERKSGLDELGRGPSECSRGSNASEFARDGSCLVRVGGRTVWM